MLKPKMKTTIGLLAAALAASSAAAQDGDTPRPNPTPVPCIQCNVSTPPNTAISSPVATGNGNAAAIANTTATKTSAAGGDAAADASNTMTIGGDTSKSLVAVFPAPSTAVVPAAQHCIVTRSSAGGLGWNLIQAAHSEQHSDPVCTLMALHARATSPAQADLLFTEILRRLAAGQ
ncbi:hypothetical protein KIH07_16930 [Hydrogenophaga taeniospiralis]|uniref:hypothetical protein n=1 Tax=Hydrogenophaga taeniospiralis TaxID=65656 RepID=UPI001CF99EAC|nr:hypothetical protein [Hydrogenophaga taeniospiralis]MCB4365430.1 hypothetical protein [Hydrogenophaga taeniospiralis]